MGCNSHKNVNRLYSVVSQDSAMFECVREYRKANHEMPWGNLLCLEMKDIQGDTIEYSLFTAASLGYLTDPNIIFFVHVDSTYVGVRNLTRIKTSELSLDEIAENIKVDFPHIYQTYEDYMDKLADGKAHPIHLIDFISDQEAWSFTTVRGKLISKKIHTF